MPMPFFIRVLFIVEYNMSSVCVQVKNADGHMSPAQIPSKLNLCTVCCIFFSSHVIVVIDEVAIIVVAVWFFSLLPNIAGNCVHTVIASWQKAPIERNVNVAADP